jgi:hypothetical protein
MLAPLLADWIAAPSGALQAPAGPAADSGRRLARLGLVPEPLQPDP